MGSRSAGVEPSEEQMICTLQATVKILGPQALGPGVGVGWGVGFGVIGLKSILKLLLVAIVPLASLTETEKLPGAENTIRQGISELSEAIAALLEQLEIAVTE